jgi:5,10-methenyltetrahydrofolate synthetase
LHTCVTRIVISPRVLNSSTAPAVAARAALRTSLRQARERFVSTPCAEAAREALAGHLLAVLKQLEAESLGLYWAVNGEFNAVQALSVDHDGASTAWALPFAQRSPPEMHYRAWDRQPPSLRDECGIPSSSGPQVVPDVVLVPCLGYTATGYRLGYGGGYYDRWLAAHPQVTAVGVAWSASALETAAFEPQPFDQPLGLIVTDTGVVG